MGRVFIVMNVKTVFKRRFVPRGDSKSSLGNRSGRVTGIYGATFTGVSTSDAKGAGIFVLGMACLFTLGIICSCFDVVTSLPVIHEHGWIFGTIMMALFGLVHVVVFFGEFLCERTIWRGGTSLLVVWGALAVTGLISLWM